MPELTLMQRILKITNELKVKKNGKNTFSKYDYFKLEDITEALNPLLEKYNVWMHYNLTQNEPKEGREPSFRGVLALMDAIDPTNKIEYVADIERAEVKGASGIQMSGATLTYGKRQAVMNAFNLSEDDDDPNSDANDSKNPKNIKAQAPAIPTTPEDRAEKVVQAFKVLGVRQGQIENKFNKPIESFTEDDFVALTKIHGDLKKQKVKKEEVFGE